MSTTHHAKTVADLVEASPYAGDVFRCPIQEASEDRCVAVWPGSDQRAPSGFLGDDDKEDRRVMHVRSRGEPNSWKQAEADMRVVREALKDAIPAGYVQVRLLRGGNYIGPDDDDRHEFSYRVLCWIVE